MYHNICVQWICAMKKLRRLKAKRFILCKVMIIKQTVIIWLVSWALTNYL